MGYLCSAIVKVSCFFELVAIMSVVCNANSLAFVLYSPAVYSVDPVCVL